MIEGVGMVKGALATAVSDNEYQGQREKSDQKDNSNCYYRGPGMKRKIKY